MQNFDIPIPTTKNRSRIVQRGDFGPTKGKSLFPNEGISKIVISNLQKIENLPYCGGDSEEGLNELDPSLRNYIEQFPESQRCAKTMQRLLSNSLKNIKTKDKRTIQSPRPGEPESPQYAALNRLEKAKICLDRSRQMYAAGKALIEKGLTMRNKYYFFKGSGMIWSIDRNNPQKPRPGKKSALYELYQAYCLVRSYEINPLPPVLVDGEPNTDRLNEDEMYQFIMGTSRMTPNRLGIGNVVRKIYNLFDIQDPNYYNPNQSKDLSKLYSNVDPNSEYGPEKVAALNSYRNDLAREKRSTPELIKEALHPNADDLDEMGYPNRKVVTDMSKALENIHSNFVDPKFQLSGFPQEGKEEETEEDLFETENGMEIPLSATVAPPKPIYNVCLDLGSPYPPGSWPFDGTQGHPNIEEPENYIAPYFPSGISYLRILYNQERGISKPPYFQTDAIPPFGEPNPDEEMIWDARVAANFLVSYNKRLEKRSANFSKLENIISYKVLGSENSNYSPSGIPLTLWKNGKTVEIDNFKAPPKTFSPKLQTWNMAFAQGLETADLEGENSFYRPRYLGWNSHVYTDNNMNNLADTQSEMDKYSVDTLYPFGIALYQTPFISKVILEYGFEKQIKMLQHALFLLSAPLNDWQISNLPERLWLKPPPPGSSYVGSITYGDNVGGQGYNRRTNQNYPNLDEMGWRGYFNPFRLYPQGGIPGRKDNTFIGIENLRTNQLPIGPLNLDPNFGSDLNHIPSSNYKPNNENTIRVWVIRTNQHLVLGYNTWGLDFYMGQQEPVG